MQTSSPIVDNLIENLSSGAQRLGAPLEEKWLHSWSGALTLSLIHISEPTRPKR